MWTLCTLFIRTFQQGPSQMHSKALRLGHLDNQSFSVVPHWGVSCCSCQIVFQIALPCVIHVGSLCIFIAMEWQLYVTIYGHGNSASLNWKGNFYLYIYIYTYAKVIHSSRILYCDVIIYISCTIMCTVEAGLVLINISQWFWKFGLFRVMKCPINWSVWISGTPQ